MDISPGEKYPILKLSLDQNGDIVRIPREESEEFLSTDEIIFLQRDLIQRTGGKDGIRDMSLLESAVLAPQSGMGEEYFYPDVSSQAAALFRSLALNHAFVDGNKRIAFHAAAYFLYYRGYELIFNADETIDFILKAVTEKLSVEEIAQWFKNHTISNQDNSSGIA